MNDEEHAAVPLGSLEPVHAATALTTRLDTLDQGKVKLPDFTDEHTETYGFGKTKKNGTTP